jgi:hypothetical protein
MWYLKYYFKIYLKIDFSKKKYTNGNRCMEMCIISQEKLTMQET